MKQREELAGPAWRASSTNGHVLPQLEPAAVRFAGKQLSGDGWADEQQQSDRYQTVLEQIPAITYAAELIPEFRTTFVSPQIQRLGYTPEEWLAGEHRWADSLHPDDKGRVLHQARTSLRRNAPVVIEYRLITRQGLVRWFRDEAHVVVDPASGRRLVHGVMLDITDRKKAEEAERRSRVWFERLAQASPCMVFRADAAGDGVYTNQRWQQLTGYPADAWQRQGWLRAVHPGDRTRVEISWTRAVQQAREWQEEFRILHRDGHTVWCLGQASPIHNEAGEVEGFMGTCTDVTRLKEAEQQLERAHADLERQVNVRTAQLSESEARWKSLALTAADFILIADRDGNIEYLNRTTEGFTFGDVLGKKIYDFAFPPYRERMRQHVQQVLDTGEIISFENVGQGPNGLACWYDTRIGPREKDGEICGVTLFITDITARKQIEARLTESEQLYRTLLEQHVDGVALLLDGRISYVNPAALELTGYTEDELLGRCAGQLVVEDERPRLVGSIRRLVRGKYRAASEYHAARKDGSSFPMELRARSITFNRQPATICFLRDVTQRKLAEEALRRSEEKWRSLVATAPNFIVIVDPDGRIRYVNRPDPSVQEQEVIGRATFDFVPESAHDELRAVIKRVMQTGEVHSMESCAPGLNNRLAWYAVNVGPFLQDGRIVGVTMIATDITACKEAEEQLRNEERLLRKLLELQEQSRLLVSHEIHDGIVQDVVGAKMVVDGAADRLRNSEPDLIPQLKHASELLSRSISEARRLISEQRPLIIDDEGIVEAIRYLVSEDRLDDAPQLYYTHDVQFDRIDPMLEGAVFRIVQESLNNVRRHSRCRKAHVHLQQIGDRLHILVADDGVGFVPDDVPRDRFGLRGIQERARLFQGHAVVHSALGEGTRVEVELPLKFIDDDVDRHNP